MFEQLGLVGCGLMGGSFALAAKRARLVRRVVGYSKSPSTTERARQLGVIDATAPSALQAVTGSDLVLIAVPVGASESTFRAIRHGLGPNALLMDVGSTKSDVIDAARAGLEDRFNLFVPAHPIAGKELAGVEHADASLFDDRQVVLTPLKTTLRSHVQRAAQLWTQLGAKVTQMTPQTHDRALASISHLPHLLAFAFVKTILSEADGDQLFDMAGPGFRDFTRIAAGDSALWRDVLLANRAPVRAQARAFREVLDRFEQMMEAGDGVALERAIAEVSARRAGWRVGVAARGSSSDDA